MRLPLHVASVALTFAATTLAWIVFRAPDLASARNVAGGLIGGGHSAVGELLAAGGGGAAAAVPCRLVHAQQHGVDVDASTRPCPRPIPISRSSLRGGFPGQPTPLNAAAYGLVCIIAVLALSNLKPFIYFQF